MLFIMFCTVIQYFHVKMIMNLSFLNCTLFCLISYLFITILDNRPVNGQRFSQNIDRIRLPNGRQNHNNNNNNNNHFRRADNEEERERERCVQNWLNKHADLSKRFSRAQLLSVCQRNMNWQQAASQPTSPVSDFMTPRQLAFLNHLRNCRGTNCVRNLTISQTEGNIMPAIIVTDGRQVQTTGDTRAVRKEYRAMTEDERRRYHESVRRLKMDKIDGMSKYDLLVVYHTPQEAPEAHFGPAFLPYHRELLKQYEIALRQIDPLVALPYWDSTLDEGLPKPADSILWTATFFGNGQGAVSDGPFAGWTAVQELPLTPGQRQLVRQVGLSPFGGLYKQSDIDFALSRNRFEDLTNCVDPTFEITHGLVHSFVGGYMLEISISPNDPSFYLHHNFIDSLWEQYRQTRQTGQQRLQDYPTPERSCTEFHYAQAQMKPFPIKNIDGLSEVYTSEMYRFEQRPMCSSNGIQCYPSSPYLFCDRRTNRCLSKVKVNGNCSGFESQDICYASSCRRGTCVLSASISDGNDNNDNDDDDTPDIVVTGGGWSATRSTTRMPILSTFRPLPPIITNRPIYPSSTLRPPFPNPEPPSPNIPVAYFTITVVRGGLDAYSFRSAYDARIETRGLGTPIGYSHVLRGEIFSNNSYPSYTGAAVAKIYDPDRAAGGRVKFTIEVVDGGGQLCRVKCWEENDKRRWYGNCANGNQFEISAGTTYPLPSAPYAPTPREALHKRWTGEGYQKLRWPDYILFQCP